MDAWLARGFAQPRRPRMRSLAGLRPSAAGSGAPSGSLPQGAEMIDAGHGCHNRARRIFGVAHIQQTRTPGRAVAHPMQKPKTPLHTWVDSPAKPSGRAIVHPIQNRKNTSLCLSGHLGQVTRSSDCTPQEKPKKHPSMTVPVPVPVPGWTARPSHPVESLRRENSRRRNHICGSRRIGTRSLWVAAGRGRTGAKAGALPV